MSCIRFAWVVFVVIPFGCSPSTSSRPVQSQPVRPASDAMDAEYTSLMAMLTKRGHMPSEQMSVGDALQLISDATDGLVKVDREALEEGGADFDQLINVTSSMTLADLLDEAIRKLSSDDLQVGYEIRPTAYVTIRSELPNRPNRIPTTPFNDKQAKADEVNRITATPDPHDPSKVYIPSDLDDCFVELKRMLHPKLVETMKSKSEDDMVEYHFGLGMWLRNNWGLWGDGSRLGKYFEKMGIQHPDDMSGIILDSFHRHLNGRPLKLDEQIAHYQAYWKKQRDEEAGNSNGKSRATTSQASTDADNIGDEDESSPEVEGEQKDGKD